jgi:hypothetical protein
MIDPLNQKNPLHPVETSVSVAQRSVWPVEGGVEAEVEALKAVLVSRQPRPRELISESRGRAGTQNANTEVQQPANDEYLERDGYEPESKSDKPAE